MRPSLLVLLAVSSLTATPALADPVIETAMPVIRANLSDDQMVVRLEQGVLGAARSLSPRTLTIIAKDASGAIVYETRTPVSRRMTYASVPATPSLRSASTVTVTVR